MTAASVPAPPTAWPLLVITRGLPGSGKTTLAKAWVAEMPWRRVRINRDSLRDMLHGGHRNNMEQERMVSLIQRAGVRAALGDGYQVVVDDTNLNDDHFDALAAIAAEFGVEVEVWDLRSIPLYVCLARNELRAGTPGYIPPAVINGMYDRYLAGSGVTGP